jgi:hypothetical protein
MGTGAFTASKFPQGLQESGPPSEWRILPNREVSIDKYTVDRTLPALSDPSQVQMLLLLRDPYGQASFGAFARSIGRMELILCWIHIEEFKSIKNDDRKRQSAKNIFKNYVIKKNIFSYCTKSISDSLSIFEVHSLVDAVNFINSRLEDHSFAEV